MHIDIEQLIKLCETSMSNIQKNLIDKLEKIHVNSININELKIIKIKHENITCNLINLARIEVKYSHLIHVIPHEKKSCSIIENSIRSYFSYLNITVNHDKLILSLPLPTIEKRMQIIKIIKTLGEESKIKIRNIRRHYNSKIKKYDMSKEKEYNYINQVQKMTDKIQKFINNILLKKITDINQV